MGSDVWGLETVMLIRVIFLLLEFSTCEQTPVGSNAFRTKSV